MPPVNTTSSCGGKVFPLMIPADSFEHPSVAYIDLVNIRFKFLLIAKMGQKWAYEGKI